MMDQEKAKTLTLEAYLEIIKERLEKGEVFKEKHQLFTKNKSQIETSLSQNLNINEKNKAHLRSQKDTNHESLDKAFNQKKADFSHAESLERENHDYDLNQIEKTLENKKNLNTLKEQKLDADYDYLIKELSETRLKEEENIESSVDEVIDKYNTQQRELSAELDDALATLAKNLEKENIAYTQNHENLKAKVKAKIAQTETKLKDNETKC